MIETSRILLSLAFSLTSFVKVQRHLNMDPQSEKRARRSFDDVSAKVGFMPTMSMKK
jgi:hypothetical protein